LSGIDREAITKVITPMSSVSPRNRMKSGMASTGETKYSRAPIASAFDTRGSSLEKK